MKSERISPFWVNGYQPFSATMEAIEKWAADEFRSTNGQLQWIINEALRKSGRLKPPKKNVNNPAQQENRTAD